MGITGQTLGGSRSDFLWGGNVNGGGGGVLTGQMGVGGVSVNKSDGVGGVSVNRSDLGVIIQTSGDH